MQQSSSQPLLVSVDLPRPGEQLGSYVIERQLGQGGMAVVYEARHRVIGKRVALKMLLPHHAACTDLAQRFQREGEAAARLDHPNAICVLDGGSDARGTPYLVLEYLEGEDLGTLLAREGKLPVTRAVDLLVPMVAAIAAAHDLGIVHRDLKPENLFLARRHRQVVPKVLDFGISKTNDAQSLKLTRSESLLGTPHYMSPEQAQGAAHADARTDQFAIGVMLYECVTGKCPFEGSSLYAVLAAIVAGELTPPSLLVEGLEPAFEAVVMRALSKEPEGRFPDLRALGVALLPFASLRIQLAYAEELGASPAHGSATSVFAPFGARRNGRSVEALATLAPGEGSLRTPVLVGSALVLAAVTTMGAFGVASSAADDEAKEPELGHAGASTRATTSTLASVVPRELASGPPTTPRPAGSNSSADQSLTSNIEAPRKPSGLHFEPIETPSLCSSPEHAPAR